MLTVFESCSLLDPARGHLLPGHHVVVEGDRIREVSDRPVRAAEARFFDLAGQTLMPGLCDAHVHVTAVDSDLAALERESPAYVTARALRVLRGMLRRGFTTVRDAGGADWGLARAVDEGICEGPRILFSGHALSQTGGHGDLRVRGDDRRSPGYPSVGTLGRLCDGAREVRVAARDELRRGARQIKIMVSGGVASPTDPITNTQFSLEEIRAAVEEAEAANTYVMAHAYSARSVRRALECGVRSIEHGNLIDAETMEALVAKGAFLVPTLATYEMIHREGKATGLPPALIEKLGDLRERGLACLELATRKGAKVAFGTDLFGPLHRYQSEELELRRRVQTPAEILRSATVCCAELFGLAGEIGTVSPGARADLLVVEGDPMEDLNLFREPDRYLKGIMKGGEWVVNRL